MKEQSNELKLVEGWYLPVQENSVMKKISSIRAALDNPEYPIDDYQVELRDEALKQVKKFNTAVDMGAHVGIWSVALSKIFKKVQAFEINTEIIPCLNLNIKSRDIANVVIYPYGLGEKESSVDIHSSLKKTMATTVVPFSEGKYQVKTLDSFKFKNVDFIKLDIEGYESFALLGSENTIKTCRPVILLEDKELHHQYNVDPPGKILERFGMVELKRFRKDALYGWP